MRFSSIIALALFFTAGNAASALAQTSGASLRAAGVFMDYDLSGTGQAMGVAVRGTKDLTSNVVLEFGGLFARPDQQFGTSTLFIPEVQLQYRWSVARLTPYVGAGLGTALVKSDFHSDWDPAISFAGGTGVRLTDRLDLVGEFRLRGVEWRFTGTTADIAAGLAWRF